MATKKTGNIAILFTDIGHTDSDKPLDKLSTRKNHIAFARNATKLGLQVFFANHKYYNNCRLKSAWYYDKGWKKAFNQEIDIVYSRFAGSIYKNNRKNKIAEKFKYKMANEIPMLNHPAIDEFCWDKSIISDLFPQFTPETHLVNTKKGLKIALSSLKSNKYVFKPRYGTLGRDVLILDKNQLPKTVEKNSLVQEFIDTSRGIKGITNQIHDLRVIIANGKIDHAFVRVPKKNVLVANVALGAKKIFVNPKILPMKAKKIVKTIDSLFTHFEPRLYSVDFIFDKKGNPFVVECNSQPMINKYAYGKYADPEFYTRICKVLKSAIRIKIVQTIK